MRMPKRKRDLRRTVIWVDDDALYLRYHADLLRDYTGWNILATNTCEHALALLSSRNPQVSAAIIDVMIANVAPLDPLSAKGGFAAGIALARRIREISPKLPILAVSLLQEASAWFRENSRMSFLSKGSSVVDIAKELTMLWGRKRATIPFSLFIVHGHDDLAKLELKNYLQNVLKLGEPVILHEQPDMGRTVLEKFEDYAAAANLVFVLLTPDDSAAAADSAESKRRARQNVIFEMGYFLAKLGRKAGKVLLLYKGPLELPSDISGLIYIDISAGIPAAGESLRREIFSSS